MWTVWFWNAGGLGEWEIVTGETKKKKKRSLTVFFFLWGNHKKSQNQKTMSIKSVLTQTHTTELSQIQKRLQKSSLLPSALVAQQCCSWKSLMLELHSSLMVKKHAHAMLANDRLGLFHWSGAFQSQRHIKSTASTSQNNWGSVRTLSACTGMQTCINKQSHKAVRQTHLLLTWIYKVTNESGLKALLMPLP